MQKIVIFLLFCPKPTFFHSFLIRKQRNQKRPSPIFNEEYFHEAQQKFQKTELYYTTPDCITQKKYAARSKSSSILYIGMARSRPPYQIFMDYNSFTRM